MQFFYHQNAGENEIILDSESYHYLFRVRRFNTKEILKVRNLIDKKLYFYKFHKKQSFILESNTQDSIESNSQKDSKDSKDLNLILAIIDLKDIYEILPFLNALNTKSLNLFYADFSQKNRVFNTQKAMKIITFSCMQCGRTDLMKINIFENLDCVFKSYKNASVIDFIDSKNTNKNIESLDNLELQNIANNGIIIGPEGGFSNAEREKLKKNNTYKLNTNNILTTHLASIYIASLVLSKC
ncbi:RsmE family RNA methyltransferase [Helicobacter saguini]|uniref:Ribosomal RNA small subunit methyltransferase E n=1 Tax=Helicobacter saguini TaxID=1548018 RepID=A0A347VPS7_9HELI|nr:RsmE family RNA methyltransferase [Helicobacter saguini]MWV61235.1 RsmE family RNA methyltransferase [Helicobacter saguini]MWV68098.1 RsmE family RNA methyltransferase [Helicobacter saguini]MWV70438.1 RsmE family RNA methyltransferase [Helicobacter saguini]MWV72339.1 RsmE family RNA methyltransferase [Helicobacter saguini]TLD92987.1 RsmE family RNA methyltransferase [Helicobacter saguini]